DSDLEFLRKAGYIRVDKERHITVPKEVLKALKDNCRVQPEPTSGLTTAQILTRMRELLAIRSDDELETGELFDEITAIIKENPDTSISKCCDKRIKGITMKECVFFYALIYYYWFEEDDMVCWYNVDSYFEECEMDALRFDARIGVLGLQRRKIIEYSGEDGMMTKDCFKIADEVKEEIFADVGGIRKKAPKVSASRKMAAEQINPKELYYNYSERNQIRQLKELMSEKRFGEIRDKMKAKGLRTGFTCLFYGSPGTGKTETVYQIARESGRDLFIVDVSQVKSCWVGESEKNIKDVFVKYREAARSCEKVPILLFNEADAIFGIRQHGAERAVDKMENSLQNIILQEMEDLDGILIATTNLTANLDKAFERRFLYKVLFAKPSIEARTSIWRSMIPELTETEARLLAAEYDFSGGQIENVSRKRTIASIIVSKEPDFDTIRSYCEEENISGSGQAKRIGF
ncbi:MAG: ATP-binding protein, partial [Bacteroidales bacterium]|nr:ATP-binding protein [Bacteroidales bacterium]